MSEGAPWLVIIGLGEDGPEGLSPASRAALERAEIVMGPPRHLALLPDMGAERVEWPVPFADGLDLLEGYRGRQVAVLASGDPFWFGAGSVIARRFEPGEWQALPGVSCFSLAAARLGWAMDKVLCLGHHAAPLTRLRPSLAPGVRMILTLRDGDAVADLGGYLAGLGFGASRLWVMEALGGPRERVTEMLAGAASGVFSHPVVVAVEIAGEGAVLPCTSGIDDGFFDSDGVMTKRPVRALTLSALAPKPGERLWDIGGGSGSIGIEWLLSHPTTQAVAIEPRADRIALIRANAAALGVDRLQVAEGRAPEALAGLDAPDVVFVGGGLSGDLLDWLFSHLSAGTRLVANAVTLESEAQLIAAHAARGGDLLRIELAQAAALGPRRGWKASYPVVQWSVTL
ncbi:bifunctional cobalt-precorrin-7 (C(5))-methyltransferase/cobalt-precorrin-6B (C(15))-methyltransferase [Mameliella sp. AT18]|uniref:bifunctional cobalt-precorrin-7 (C(5))-methyltransferase/cobalt-precorrin-6B (C(15))-methyltransferase n=1 Tax=Mameliella sp. AT18 TaxID=3028385 RepID=UPI00084114BE|nr:bifunctional cobalt-precorrin-7 (C(5))-methyltransferase/cobalt-precorrin-6B (C(15))-methyltransferase [Mameliella sp. AT18]MDD9728399.1 bifunctional cobalt-precorrin-7 (C(5))-methyltransferase/cobalt-precorrin-6B (C(15))-methyltransferase [Mameliella sp. AT18]ODM48149.1 precorrin-6Y methyltransferase [Ruegeria sp. PBVC088]